MTHDPSDEPRVTTRNVLWAIAFLAVAGLVVIPLGLCSSLLVLGTMTYSVLGERPYVGEIAFGVACIPVIVAVGFLIRHAIQIAKGE